MSITIGAKRHRVFLQNPGPPMPDGDGGYTLTWVDLAPAAVNAGIVAAEAQDLERFKAETVVASATKRVDTDYHPQVSLKTRILFGAQVLSIVGVTDPDETHTRLVLLCVDGTVTP